MRRIGPALLAASILAWGLGDIYWIAAIKNDETPPYPSLADAVISSSTSQRTSRSFSSCAGA